MHSFSQHTIYSFRALWSLQPTYVIFSHKDSMFSVGFQTQDSNLSLHYNICFYSNYLNIEENIKIKNAFFCNL